MVLINAEWVERGRGDFGSLVPTPETAQSQKPPPHVQDSSESPLFGSFDDVFFEVPFHLVFLQLYGTGPHSLVNSDSLRSLNTLSGFRNFVSLEEKRTGMRLDINPVPALAGAIVDDLVVAESIAMAAV